MATEWAKANGRQIDLDKVWQQVMVLNGFSEDQFDLPADKRTPPQPPPVKYSMSINADLETVLRMDPSLAPFLAKLMTEGHVNIDAKLKESGEAQKRNEFMRELGKTGSPSHPLVATAPTTDVPQMPMA